MRVQLEYGEQCRTQCRSVRQPKELNATISQTDHLI